MNTRVVTITNNKGINIITGVNIKATRHFLICSVCKLKKCLFLPNSYGKIVLLNRMNKSEQHYFKGVQY